MSEGYKQFGELCKARGPPGAVYANVSRVNGEILAEVGNPGKLCNLYSSTKSMVGLTIAHDTKYHGFDPMQDIRDFLPKNVSESLTEPVPLMALLNHTSGISKICMSNPGVVLDLLTRRRNTQAVIETYLEEIGGAGRPFSYSPILGYMVAGAVYEQIKRSTDEKYSLKQTCSRLFFPADIMEGEDWEWAQCDGVELCKHTFAFSEFRTTGRTMIKIGRNLINNHRDLLQFILSSNKPAGMYVRHARSARAGGAGGHECNDEVAEVNVDYDYSFGWWLLPSSEILTTIGLGGQYIVLDLKQNIVAARQQAVLFNNMRPQFVQDELRVKKRGFILSTHETFPLLARDYASSRKVDFYLERWLLFFPPEFKLAETICADIIAHRHTAWTEAILSSGFFDKKEMTVFEIEDAVVKTFAKMKQASFYLLNEWPQAVEYWYAIKRPNAGMGKMGIFSIFFIWKVSNLIKK